MRRMLGLLPISMFVLALAVSAADAAPTATVTGGELRGILMPPGGAVFKGIPYARPPVAERRWRPPATVESWTGVRDATAFGAPCAQNSRGRALETASENCLFLNVWTPQWPPRSPLAVMVWLHGGGNYGGTASSATFDGEKLARHGIVLVTVNYRLGVFGFFVHPALTGESPHHSSGNYGLLDQIAALHWVRDNIARFGGDPAKVTIFGQSAGAVDVNVLLTSPLAKGLFQRAIAESGTVTRNPDEATLGMTALGAVMQVKGGPLTYSDAPLLADAEKSGQALAATLNAPVAGTLQYLRSLPAAKLLEAASGHQTIGPANGIVVDGWVLPKPPAEVFAAGRENQVPLMVGNNARERTPPGVTPEALAQAMQAMYGPLAAKASALYRGADDPLYGGSATQWVVDTMYRCPVVEELVWHAAAGNAAYEYQFDRAAPGRETVGAVHGSEVPYVFGVLDAAGGGPRYAAPDHALSEALQSYWTNFAKTGDPNGAGSPTWPRFEASTRAYLELTEDGPAAHHGLRRPFCDLYLENVKRLIKQSGTAFEIPRHQN